jgi:uncharacterized lipoprotein YddW (UPF0748 family)
MYMRIVLALLFTVLVLVMYGQAPKRELRGAWIATVNNIDWPSAGANAATQQAQLITLLNNHKASGMNAVYMQIRTQCDALYNSSIEPWSSFVSSAQGVNPGYDPLAFAIAECRKRGMELHAWINPYRAVINNAQIGTFANNHIAVARPDLLLSQGSLRILDPGKTEVWSWVIKVVMDVVRRYDVDGIHFDDYFYPYPPSSGAAFNDSATYNATPRGFTNIYDWRRANVDSLIKRTNDSIHLAKPWVKFGISPFGIWRNAGSDATGSATNGLQSYSDIYANSKKWIQNNWVDYLAPQLYWSIGLSVANYGVLVPWWNSNAFNRHIYSGMAAYKVGNGGTDVNFNNASQIPNQIRLNRQYPKVLGGIFYNSTSVNSNPLGMRDSLRNDLWKRPALLPQMHWIDNTPPQQPSLATTTLQGTNNVLVQWTAPTTATNEMDKAKQYVVYRFNSATNTLTDSSAIITVTPVDTVQYVDNNVPNGTYYYIITSLDRMHNESIASNVSTITLGTTNVNAIVAELQSFKIFTTGNSHTFFYSLTQKSRVRFTILSQDGRTIATQNRGTLYAGSYSINNLTSNLPSGVYYAKLEINGKVKTVQFVK